MLTIGVHRATGIFFQLEQVRYIDGGKIVECFEGYQKDLKLYPVGDGKPMKFFEEGSYMVMFWRQCEYSCSCVLNALEFFNKIVWESIVEAIVDI